MKILKQHILNKYNTKRRKTKGGGNMLFLPEESSIDVNLLERMQEENIVTSYKLFWFRGIFREIINGNRYAI